MWPNAVAAGVFSAHAEVVPPLHCHDLWGWCILRARGGSSVSPGDVVDVMVYSPRTRR